jgi:DNA-binding SARP family transcriptional activator
MEVQLDTLGTTSVRLGETAIPSLPGKPMSFGLLVFLGVEREATRDRLISTFWPESSQEKARHTLSQALYELRQELGEGWMESTGNGVRATEALQVDVLEFEAKAEEGSGEEAIAIYGGHFLDGVHLAQTHPFEEWVERKRARLARRHRVVAETLIKKDRDGGNPEGALQTAWKWVGLDPLDDGAQHYLIRLLWETGSRTEALAEFQRYETLLEKELGLEPLDDTKELVEEIRSGVGQPPTALNTQVSIEPAESHGVMEEGGQGLVPAIGPQSWTQIRDRFSADLSPPLEILRPIGHSSMAEVFLAREPHLKRLVAVKVLSPGLATDKEARARFEREAQSAARINHPNVCTVHRIGTLEDGTPFLVTPFVKGNTAAQRLAGEGRLTPDQVRPLLREVASALAAAHELGIVHRDVGPDNILLEEATQRHYLCDFGLAGVLETGDSYETRLTGTGQILGNPSYMSPEQAAGEPVTDRSDVYSLGVLGYELLTGDAPFGALTNRDGSGGGQFSALMDYASGWSEPDRGLVDILLRCVAPHPSHRPSAVEIEEKLKEQENSPERGSMVYSEGEKPLRSIIDRRLPQFLGGYVAAAWMTLEFTQYMVAREMLPEVAEALALLSVPFGFVAVTITGWFHGEKGPQEMVLLEKWLLAVVVAGWLAGCFLVLF